MIHYYVIIANMKSFDKNQATLLVLFYALAVIMTMSPLGTYPNSNFAFAGGNHQDDNDDDDRGDGNSASQIISQVQRSIQDSQVVSGDDIEDSGNNFNFQDQDNSGNNAAAQRNGGDDNEDDSDDDDDSNGNNSNQGIGQSQSSRQNSQCVSGGDASDSCNNINFKSEEKSGNNAAGQQGGGDDDDDSNGNNSNQGIGQSQSTRQNSQCVAGGSLSNSCNNLSFQNQENSGNNAAGQQGGGDDDDDSNGNNSNQGIGQDQNNEQNAQCVSGEDAIVSCDNVSFQNQVNSGNNALAQD